MKHKTIKILATETNRAKRFNALFTVFRSVSKNAREIAAYNSGGVASLDKLEYDLKKYLGIRDLEVHSFTKKASKEKPVVFTLADLEDLDYHKELKPLAASLAEKYGKEPASQKKADLLDFILEVTDSTPVIPLAAPTMEQEAKEGFKLRELFPFLTEEDCPDEFKILVADKITGYENWKESYKELQANGEKLSNEEIYELASKAVEGFELDLDIMDELEYYQEHKEILGKHPIFFEHNLIKEVKAIKVVDLVTERNNLKFYIARDRKALEEGKIAEDKKEDFENKIKEFELKMKYVEERIAEHE